MKSLMKWILLVVAVVLLGGCGDDNDAPPPVIPPPPVVTTELYGTTTGNGTLGASVLVKLDPDTGALLRTIGSTSHYINGLEYDETNGKLYGTTSTNDPVFPDGLIEINIATGVSTTIGSAGIPTVMNPTVNSAGQMYGWTEDSDDLVIIDKATGVATVVGDFVNGTAEHGLAFDSADNLYFVNSDGSVYVMSTTTGTGALQGTLGTRAHHGEFHPVTGQYWGIDKTNDSGIAARNLLVVSMATPTIVATHATVDNLHAITFRDMATTQLFGTTTGHVSLGTSTLVRLSPKTGKLISTIGSVGHYVSGLVYDEVSGKLYGTTSTNDPVFPKGLIEINMTTGASTTIGLAGLDPPVATPAVNSAGQMYGWSGWHASGIGIRDLVTINKATGAATVVGNSDINTYEQGLVFDNADRLYLVNGNGSIYLVSTATGSCTLQGSIGVRAHHGSFHPVTGLYWGIDATYDSGPTARNLRVVSMATPTIVGTHATVDQLHAITFKK